MHNQLHIGQQIRQMRMTTPIASQMADHHYRGLVRESQTYNTRDKIHTITHVHPCPVVMNPAQSGAKQEAVMSMKAYQATYVPRSCVK